MNYSIEYYGATWCKVCVTVKPAVEKLANDFAVKFSEYDIDELEGDERVANIKKVPTLRLYKGGELVQEIVTGHESALKNFLSSVKTVTITDDF